MSFFGDDPAVEVLVVDVLGQAGQFVQYGLQALGR